MIAIAKADGRSLVIEIASNDGYLLQYYRQADVPVLGIEPAVNIAEHAQSEHGIPTLPRFFSRELALDIEGCGQQADVVHANNVLAHVADSTDFSPVCERCSSRAARASWKCPTSATWSNRSSSTRFITSTCATSR